MPSSFEEQLRRDTKAEVQRREEAAKAAEQALAEARAFERKINPQARPRRKRNPRPLSITGEQ